jgi:hypothetical protein
VVLYAVPARTWLKSGHPPPLALSRGAKRSSDTERKLQMFWWRGLGWSEEVLGQKRTNLLNCTLACGIGAFMTTLRVGSHWSGATYSIDAGFDAAFRLRMP